MVSNIIENYKNRLIWDEESRTWVNKEKYLLKLSQENKYYKEDKHLACCLDCKGLGYTCQICSFEIPN